MTLLRTLDYFLITGNDQFLISLLSFIILVLCCCKLIFFSWSPVDPQDVICLAIEEMAVDQLPSNMSDDQPLSMWFEGMQSPKTADASSKLIWVFKTLS